MNGLTYLWEVLLYDYWTLGVTCVTHVAGAVKLEQQQRHMPHAF